MKKTFNKLNLDVYEETLGNGLKIYIAPLDRNEVHARIAVNYGSSTLEFKPKGKDNYIKIPQGTAHFLEHKMFAQEDGTDIMNIFHKNGATSNAYTSAFQTVYHFTGPTNFIQNLENLLNCVTMPYYTKENVEKEMGIIDQEIKAGIDNPRQISYYTVKKNAFAKLPFRYPVPGTSESIKEITSEVLYDCYNTFYHPSNMNLIIAGNVDVKETMDFIKKYFSSKKYPQKNKLEIKKYNEPKTVYKKREVIKRKVTNKLVTSGYKLCIDDINMPIYKLMAYLGIYLDIKFGSISKFNKKAFEDKNILNSIDYYIEIIENFMMIHFSTEVIKENNIFTVIHNNINDKDISEEDFELIKKNLIKTFILNSDSVSTVAGTIDHQTKYYGKVIYSMYDELKSLNYTECINLIKNIDFSNYTCVIVEK